MLIHVRKTWCASNHGNDEQLAGRTRKACAPPRGPDTDNACPCRGSGGLLAAVSARSRSIDQRTTPAGEHTGKPAGETDEQQAADGSHRSAVACRQRWHARLARDRFTRRTECSDASCPLHQPESSRLRPGALHGRHRKGDPAGRSGRQRGAARAAAERGRAGLLPGDNPPACRRVLPFRSGREHPERARAGTAQAHFASCRTGIRHHRHTARHLRNQLPRCESHQLSAAGGSRQQ